MIAIITIYLSAINSVCSNNSDREDLTVLFKMGLSRAINKLY